MFNIFSLREIVRREATSVPGRQEDSSDDSDALEEYTLEQEILKGEELTKLQTQNKVRVVREGKERRRQWAQKLTPRQSRKDNNTRDIAETET